jgi:membrane associated rhomboid family serine protease
MLVAVIVAFLYGGALLAGVVPRYGSSVSWDGHLLGGIAGSIVAYSLVNARRQSDAIAADAESRPRRAFDER